MHNDTTERLICFSQEKQEVIIEKMTRNKRKCITTVKGLELFGKAVFHNYMLHAPVLLSELTEGTHFYDAIFRG